MAGAILRSRALHIVNSFPSSCATRLCDPEPQGRSPQICLAGLRWFPSRALHGVHTTPVFSISRERLFYVASVHRSRNASSLVHVGSALEIGPEQSLSPARPLGDTSTPNENSNRRTPAVPMSAMIMSSRRGGQGRLLLTLQLLETRPATARRSVRVLSTVATDTQNPKFQLLEDERQIAAVIELNIFIETVPRTGPCRNSSTRFRFSAILSAIWQLTRKDSAV